MSDFNCPHCKSESTQRLSVVYDSGVSTIDTRTKGVGVGSSGRGLGLGVGAARTRGTQISAIAARVAPPSKKRPIATFFALSLVSAVASQFFGRHLSMPAFWAGVAGAAYIAYTMFKFNGTPWRALFETWSQRFLCHKCGEQFSPGATASS